MTEETKPGISQMETTPIQHHNGRDALEELAEFEDEPQTPYQLGWRTILAVITLSMGNVCAAQFKVTNSVLTMDLLRQTQQSNSKLRLLLSHQQMLRWHRGSLTGTFSWFLPWVPFS
jgi:hypothetical protein